MKKYLALIVIYYLVVLLVRFVPTTPRKSFEVSFLDVGQGDAIAINYKNLNNKDLNILIDGGPPGSLQQALSGKTFPFCKFDFVFITHLHLDHFGGLTDLLQACSVGALMFNDVDLRTRTYLSFKQLIANKFGNKNIQHAIFSNNKIEYGDLTVIALWPTQEFYSEFKPADDLNQLSTVLYVDYKDFEMLLTGDAESETLNKLNWAVVTPLIDNGLDVLKVPHHGSQKGLNAQIMLLLQPKYCVISVGKGNKYGHPTDYTLSLLASYGCKILRTDESGTIEFGAD